VCPTAHPRVATDTPSEGRVFRLESATKAAPSYRGRLAPNYFHCELVRDFSGSRMAKRHDALSVRHLRESGMTRKEVQKLAKV
jgi:glutamyl/glutaminyl-tRNA synthetase